MMMSKYRIASDTTWRVVCKDCLLYASFDHVEAAHSWMDGHDRDCAGTHR